MVYIALAHRCEVWTKGAEGAVKRLGRTRIAADAGLGLTRTKQALATLVSNGLVTIRRTGRTNIYTVRIPAAALELVNTTPRRATLESEPWKADGVSRRTWYRDRARTDPKTTHGGKRLEQSVSGEIPVSSGTNRTLSSGTDGQTGSPSDGQTGSPSDGQTGSPSDGQTGSPSTGSVGSTRTSATRWTCPDCGNDWPKSYGPECHPCRDRARETAKPRATAQPTHDEPKRCTCGEAYHQSYGRRCVDCKGEPSAAQRDALETPAPQAAIESKATVPDVAPPPKAEPTRQADKDRLMRFWTDARAQFNREHHMGGTDDGQTDDRTEARIGHDGSEGHRRGADGADHGRGQRAQAHGAGDA